MHLRTLCHIMLRVVLLPASWAVGLVIAAVTVPGVTVTVRGFLVAVVVFVLTQVSVSVVIVVIMQLPRRYAILLLGGTGLATTILALVLASVLTPGLGIDGTAQWPAVTLVVWLVTTIVAITLPELLIRDADCPV